MPVIAVINRKGGSGKSTLATHLAAYCAHRGHSVLMGDADFQQSSHAWLRLRDKQRLAVVPRIVGWTVDPKNVLRAPAGVTHIALDTPGGLKGYELLRVVMLADAVLVPVCYSMFDRESAAECIAELQAHPRVVRGRCRIATVGMRLDARTKAEESLRKWAAAMKVPFLGGLRETQTYVKCLEHGLTIFDMPAAKVESDLAQWQPILQWLRPVLEPAPAEIAAAQRKITRPVRAPGSSPAGIREPVPAAAEEPAALDSPTVVAAKVVEAAKAASSATVAAPARMPVAATVAMLEAATPADANRDATSIRDAAAIRDAATTREVAIRRDAAPTRDAGTIIRDAASIPDDVAAAAERRPAPSDDDLDSRFGFSTRIGRWLEMLSLRRAR